MKWQSADSFEELLKIEEQFAQIRMEYWLRHDLYTWQWWVELGVLIIPWLIWWKLVDKKRLKEILLMGCFVLISAILVDELGTEFNQWDYPHRIIPIYPQLMPADCTVLPIFYMLIYQYTTPWKAYSIALAVMAGVFSFVFEPLLVMLDMYVLLDWKNYYSFPAYILLGIVSRWLVMKIQEIQGK